MKQKLYLNARKIKSVCAFNTYQLVIWKNCKLLSNFKWFNVGNYGGNLITCGLLLDRSFVPSVHPRMYVNHITKNVCKCYNDLLFLFSALTGIHKSIVEHWWNIVTRFFFNYNYSNHKICATYILANTKWQIKIEEFFNSGILTTGPWLEFYNMLIRLQKNK